MKEQLITFDTAKLAKEKGYLFEFAGSIPTNIPTQSLLQRWLREEHNILISVYSNASGYLWNMMYAIGGTDIGWSEYSGDDEASGTFTTYEKALEAGLQEALKLI